MKKKLLIGLIIVLALMGFIYYQYTRSFSYQYTAGRQADASRDYEEAMTHYVMALEKDPNDTRVLVALGNDCMRLKRKVTAEQYLLRAVQQNGSYRRAFQLLLSLYEQDGEYDKMEDVLKYAKTDETKAIFNDYLIKPPMFSEIAGKYTHNLMLHLYVPSGGDDYEIFYTLDGKAPNGVNGHLYDGYIYLSEGKTTVKAVCRNANGKFGQVVTQKYTIRYPESDEDDK